MLHGNEDKSTHKPRTFLGKCSHMFIKGLFAIFFLLLLISCQNKNKDVKDHEIKVQDPAITDAERKKSDEVTLEDSSKLYLTVEPALLRKVQKSSGEILEKLNRNVLLVKKSTDNQNHHWLHVQKAIHSGYVKSEKLKPLSQLSTEEQSSLLLNKFDAILMTANQDLNSKNRSQFINAEFEYAELVTRLLPEYICRSQNRELLTKFLTLKDKAFTGSEYSAVALTSMFLKCPEYMISEFNNSGIKEALIEELYGLEWNAQHYLDTNSYEYDLILKFYQDNVKGQE